MQENTDIMQIGNVFQSANRENPNPGRVYDDKGLCPTLGTMQGGNREPMIVETTKVNYVDMTETVKVRKHEIDTKALSNLLRSHKTISNKEISKRLNVPITMVEHWFRRDDSSSVPSPELWFQLKKLLEIETDEFDKVITEFEERDGVFEKAARVYLTDSLSPTLTATATDEKIVEIKKMDENKMRESVCVGGFGEKTSNNGTQYYQQDRVYEREMFRLHFLHSCPVAHITILMRNVWQ